MRSVAALLLAGIALAAAATAAAPGASRNGRPPQVNYMTECQG